MKYIFIFSISLSLANIWANLSFAAGEAQGYSMGYAEGKRVEPDAAQCIGYWFGGKVPADRMNELKNFCKEMK